MAIVGSPDDFNFEVGDWRVHHRRLNGRLVGSQDWEEFSGTCSMGKILGGSGNIEDNFIDFPSGPYRAIALRSFDPSTGQWAIWWLDGRSPHSLDVPVIGGFENGEGTFYADDSLDGRPIKVRFRWRETGSNAPVWDQAFSADGALTWETNWVMQFTRA
jgi:hypothetical protein